MTLIGRRQCRWLAVLAACGLLISCGEGRDGGTTASTSSAPTTSTSPTTTAATAYGQVAPFIHSAQTLDDQLKTAAAAINATGPPWRSVTADVAATVATADRTPLASAIPAGMPRNLLQQTILVYSDLLSRRFAMQDFATAGTIPDDQYFDETQQRMLTALANGQAAAARFPNDLSDLETLAAATPRFPSAAPMSRAQAEALLLDRYVTMAEGGCDGRGGVILTVLPAIVWQPFDDESSGRHFDGTIGTIPFTATPVNGTWQIEINAC